MPGGAPRLDGGRTPVSGGHARASLSNPNQTDVSPAPPVVPRATARINGRQRDVNALLIGWPPAPPGRSPIWLGTVHPPPLAASWNCCSESDLGSTFWDRNSSQDVNWTHMSISSELLD